jgi:hypothetical protein
MGMTIETLADERTSTSGGRRLDAGIEFDHNDVTETVGFLMHFEEFEWELQGRNVINLSGETFP